MLRDLTVEATKKMLEFQSFRYQRNFSEMERCIREHKEIASQHAELAKRYEERFL